MLKHKWVIAAVVLVSLVSSASAEEDWQRGWSEIGDLHVVLYPFESSVVAKGTDLDLCGYIMATDTEHDDHMVNKSMLVDWSLTYELSPDDPTQIVGSASPPYDKTDINLEGDDKFQTGNLTPGTYTLRLTATPLKKDGITLMDGVHSYENKTKSADITVTVYTVTFSSKPIVTGYTIDPNNGNQVTSLYKHINAHVEPAGAVDIHDFTFDKDGAIDEFTIEDDFDYDGDGSGVSFSVGGLAATPDTESDGDAWIQAKDGNGNVIAEAAVLVVVPAAIGTPHPVWNAAPQLVRNMAADSASIPPAPASPGHVWLLTLYQVNLTVPVVDQLQEPLDSVYDGAPVEENKGHGYLNIQVAIDSGTYADAVGPGSAIGSGGAPVEFNNNDARVANWVAGQAIVVNGTTFTPPLAMPASNHDPDETFNVRVGGHVLAPGVVNRQVDSTSPPNNIHVQWAN